MLKRIVMLNEVIENWKEKLVKEESFCRYGHLCLGQYWFCCWNFLELNWRLFCPWRATRFLVCSDARAFGRTGTQKKWIVVHIIKRAATKGIAAKAEIGHGSQIPVFWERWYCSGWWNLFPCHNLMALCGLQSTEYNS